MIYELLFKRVRYVPLNYPKKFTILYDLIIPEWF
jgi:hypothetical protein